MSGIGTIAHVDKTFGFPYMRRAQRVPPLETPAGLAAVQASCWRSLFRTE